MGLRSYTIIILLSAVVILSYVFNVVSRKTKIPSVLLLIATGIGIKYTSGYYGYPTQEVSKLVKILGAVGLIMIVLEAALDLKVDNSKIKLIRNSFSSAGLTFVFSALSIGLVVSQWLSEPLELAFLYAVPLSIISSAIVIPSTSHLPEDKKEFIIYESSFSDILGILVFNYMIMKNIMSFGSLAQFTGNIGLAILISGVATLLLVYILATSKVNAKFFLLFAILSLVYAMGELIHLPSLLIVLVFGLVLNNIQLILKGRSMRWIKLDEFTTTLNLLKSITAETSFLIRTFFFILFGYTINLDIFKSSDVWTLGSIIVFILLFTRYLYLKFILKSSILPELFLMPRGLVTILLFYSIPATKKLDSFNEGILFFVVTITSLLMMVGLILFKEDKDFLKEADKEY